MNRNEKYAIAEMQGNLGNWIFGYMYAYVWAKQQGIEDVYAKPETFDFYKQIKYYNSLKDTIFRNIKFVLNCPTDTYTYRPEFFFKENDMSEIENKKKVMFCGAVQHYDTYKNYRQDFIDIFGPTQEIKDEIKNLYGDLSDTVGFNIRLGDFRDWYNYWTYEKEEIDYILDVYCQGKKVIITSDDIEWCKLNIKHPQVVFADKKSDKFNKMVIDFYLNMQCGENIISAGSTFSWLGAWMNEIHGGECNKVYSPKLWLREKLNLEKNSDSVILEPWTKINLRNRYRD